MTYDGWTAADLSNVENDLVSVTESDVTAQADGEDVTDARRAVRRLVDERERAGDSPSMDWFKSLPLTDAAIDVRTTVNRISLADDVPAIENTGDFGGYLDIVMHGDQYGTQADITGQRIDFTSEQLADMITSSPSWDTRPIRLMSCKTGQADLAQDLADSLGVAVYAPSDDLAVAPDGTTWVENPGSWRRFEPRQ